ncbi:hypothetical protein L2E82_22535 [Cichorium intybus]|uniref:Uncharacterized protein n=1 Tax=Cichorium intybus TaxID=13427 RepID=A0ACB9DXI3_CICIN|nr:hypothetical protein L2E82_22535 [Cichorium intybus]
MPQRLWNIYRLFHWTSCFFFCKVPKSWVSGVSQTHLFLHRLILRNMGQESSPSQDDIERNIFWCKGRQVLRCFVENNRQNHFTSSPDERDERNKVLLARGSSAVSSDYKEPNFIKKLREMKSLIEEWGPMSMDSDEGLRVILDFNPSAASISLSSFRGANYGFEALSRTFKKDNYSQKHGNCRMTRSYRNVQPIVAKQSNIQCKCVPVQEIMTAMAATSIAINLISQPNLLQILMMAGIGMGTNFVLAMRPERTHNISPLWLKVVVDTCQFIPIFAAHLFRMPKTTIVYTIGASVLGAVLGSMMKASVGGSNST